MADLGLLYPATPAGVPAGLAKPGLRYRLQVVLVLLTLFLFLFLYLAFLIASLGVLGWAIWPLATGTAALGKTWLECLFHLALRGGVIAAAAMLSAFLLKGFFKRGRDDTSRYLEITERQQPDLFQFLRSVCREIGCTLPQRAYLSHEVNAAVFYPVSILNLFVPPHKDLHIGLGLVNGLNLVEFKALLAHELAHFSQRTLRLGGYVAVVHQVIASMVNTRDRWDNWVVRGFDTPWVSAFAVPLYALAELTRALLKGAFRLLNFAHLSLRRQMEFNADLVAVSVAGSDAPVHILLKFEFLEACLQQAAHDLVLPAEQGLFTRDLFFHQQRAGELLRDAQKKPDLGRPPELPSDASRQVEIFQTGEASTAAKGADHPSNRDREQNAKRRYFRSPQDDRPAWILLRDQETVREEVTRCFYRTNLELEPGESLAAPEQIQAFLDEERAAATFDPRYRGIYDNRYLNLEDFDQLVRDDRPEVSATPEKLSSSLGELYSDELQSWVANHRRRQDEHSLLDGFCSGRCKSDGEGFEFRGQRQPIDEAATLLAMVQAELEVDRRYLANFDRSVFILNYYLAKYLGREQEFRQRYEFHLHLQQLFGGAWEQKGRVESVLQFLYSRKQVQWGEVSELKETLAQVWRCLAEVFRQAHGLLLPSLKHLKAGDPLAALLPPEPAPVDLTSADTALDVETLAMLHKLLATVVDRLGWIHAKSLGGILVFQEDLANERSDKNSGTERANDGRDGPTEVAPLTRPV